MKSKKILISLGLVSIPILLLSVLLWALPAGATHTTATAGTLTVKPTAVSPDDVNVSTADRTITITLDDINLNKPLFVGTGPKSEIADLSTGGAPSTGGERIAVGSN